MCRPSLKQCCLAILLAAAPFSVPKQGAAAEDFSKLYLDAKPIFDVRLRHELVDQQGTEKDANASTVRTRFGFETGKVNGIGFGVDAEWIKALGDDNFNSTTNGRSNYPTVADPDDFALNQLYLVSQGTIPKTTVKLGRQRIIWDNSRFIGNVGWRQNEQTFDALRLSTKAVPDTELEYTFLEEVHRIFGRRNAAGRLRSDSHGFRLKYTGLKFAAITPFALLLDYDLGTQAGNESQTYGIRVNGKTKLNADMTLLYDATIATQSDYADNTADYDLLYYNIEPGIKYKMVTAKLGYEVLQGNGTSAFQTPLATLHKFNGFTDKFLSTPADGLQDLNLKLATKTPADFVLPGVVLKAAFHEFFSDENGSHYGSEWNLAAVKAFNTSYGKYVLVVKYADYDGDEVGTNTRKLWLSLNFKLSPKLYTNLVRGK